MAISAANLTSAIDTTDYPSGTNPSTGSTPSITPTANSRVIFAIAFAKPGADTAIAADSLTLSGANLTFTELAEVQYGTRRALYVVSATGASPTTEAVLMAWTRSGGTLEQVESICAVDEFTGVDGTTPYGTIVTDSGAGATSASLTGLGTPDTGDYVYAVFVHTGASSAMTINGELSNELVQLGGGGETRRILTAYDSTPDSTPNPGVSWTGAEDWAGVAFIVNAAAGGGGGISTAWLTA